MSGVDNRIVTMQFNNRDFEKNARTSLNTMAKIKESMNFGSIVAGTVRGLGAITSALGKIGLRTPFDPMIRAANSGLNGISTVLDKMGMKNPFANGVQGASELQRAAQAAAGPSGMGMLEGGVTAVSSKFIALTTIAVTALSNITSKVMSSTTAWVKSFTIDPIKDGLNEYQTTLQSIQTVQANTDAPLSEVEDSLKKLNDYSDTTIYNFGEMAKNVGTFTAAGVNLKDSVASIQGIANIAALSGSNSQQAAGAMYQLSQAIAAGKVGAQDWNSVVNAGMAGKKLQTALAQTAVAMGVLNKEQVKTNKSTGALMINQESFKNSIMASPGQESWLTSGILVNTLATLDGRFSKSYQQAQLLENGTRKFTDAQIESNMALARANLEKKSGVKFSDQQYKDLLRMADAATRSAQDVKTLGQVFGIAKETIGSGWSASFKSIFGNLKQSKKLFTGMSNGLGEIIRQNALARNTLLADWSGSKLGGRATLIAGLTQAWENLKAVMGAVSKAFRDVFPAKTAEDLRGMTLNFALLMEQLKPSPKTLKSIHDIARGVFSILDIGKTVLIGVVAGFKNMFSAIGAGDGDFLGLLANIGNSITAFSQFLKESGIVTSFFTSLGGILAIPLSILAGIGKIIGSIFEGFTPDTFSAVGDAVGEATDKLSGLQALGQGIQNFFTGLSKVFRRVGDAIGNALGNIGDLISDAITPETFSNTLDVINTGLLGAIVLMIHQFFKKGVQVDLTGGLFDGIKDTLGAATGALENMQANLKANIILKIGIAIGVLAAALYVLSSIDPGAMRVALSAMAAGFGLLIGAMVALMKFMGPVGIAQIWAVSSAMTKLAGSILILSLALKVLAGIKFGEMLRGLVGLGAMLFIMNKAMVAMAPNSKGMVRTSVALILMGVALNILAVALKIFASMSWEEMGKGLAGVAATLLVLSAGLKVMPEMKAEAIGLILLATAMNILAVALKIFATMSWEEMGKGLTMMASTLGIIALAIRKMPKTMMLQAAALVLVAGAVTVLAGALKILSSFSPGQIAKSLIMLGGSLAILAIGLNAMNGGAIFGAAALVVAATALGLLLPVLVTFGAMKVSSIVKSMTMLAGVFLILGVAGYALAPVTLVLIGLGAAMVLFGAGLALAGAGALAAATAFSLVVATGTAGIEILAALIGTVVSAIPSALAAFGKGIVMFAVAIGVGAPKIAAAFGEVLGNLIDQVTKNAPKMARMFLVMLNSALAVLSNGVPRIINVGIKLIFAFLNAVRKNIGRLVDVGASIIVNFLNGISRNLKKIIQAGVNLLLSFIEGLTAAIRKNSRRIGEAGADLGIALAQGMADGLKGASKRIKDAAMAAAKDAWNSVKDFFKIGSPSRLMHDTVGVRIPEGMAGGIKTAAPVVGREMTNLGKLAVIKMERTMSDISDALTLDPNMSPTISPVLDLGALTKEANKMSSILAVAPILPTVSFRAASDISTATQASPGGGSGPDGSDGGDGRVGDTYLTYEQHLHSPTPIDSVAAYRSGKSLIALKKEELTK